MRKFARFLPAILVASLLLSTSVAAQTSCVLEATENPDDGQIRYMDCQRDQREQRARQLVDLYRLQIENQKNIRKNFFEQRRVQTDILWKQANFDLERQIDIAEERIAQLRLGDESRLGIRQQELQIDAFSQRRDLQRGFKDRTIDLYNDRERMEITYLDQQLRRYELSVRGYPVIVFDW